MLFTITSIFLLFSYLSRVLAQAPGTISAPTVGQHIAPGSFFDFSYHIRADYCISTYAFSVWLLTTEPTSLAPAANFVDGYFFGRFEAENFPGQYPLPIPLDILSHILCLG